MNIIYSDLKQHFQSFPANKEWELWGQTGNNGIYYPLICFNTPPCMDGSGERLNVIYLDYYVPFRNDTAHTGSYIIDIPSTYQITIWFETEKRFLKIFNNWETIVQNIQLLSEKNFDISCCEPQIQSTDESIDCILYRNDFTNNGIRIDLSMPIISLPD